MRRLRLIASLLASVVTAQAATAQLLSAGVGAGTGVGRRYGAAASASHTHGLAWVQLGLPLIPIAVRGDALFIGKGTGGGPLALSANAVFSLPIPIVTPYATAGYGTYGIGGTKEKGWSAGVGVRVKAPALPGLFGELRRHERLGRDLATVGLVL